MDAIGDGGLVVGSIGGGRLRYDASPICHGG